MALINMMESFVKAKLDCLIEGMDCCKCDECKGDMMAIALNDLPSKYVNTSTGELFSRVDSLMSQNNVDIEIAIIKAVNIVSKRPRHSMEEQNFALKAKN